MPECVDDFSADSIDDFFADSMRFTTLLLVGKVFIYLTSIISITTDIEVGHS